MVEFVMFVGLPASGKSTYAKEYEKNGYKILSSDIVREEFSSQIERGELTIPDNTNLNSMVFEELSKIARANLLEGKSVVLDATNLARKRRKNFLRTLYKVKCKKICLLFITPVDECYRRNSNRTGYACVPDDAMYRMICSFECPNYFEGFDEITPIVSDIEYSFDFSLVKDFNQESKYHSLTLDKHMQKAYEYSVENNFSKHVIKCAKYHDIGKVYTKRYENSKGEPSEIPHYYNHENYGAYLYLVEHCSGKNLSKEEFNIVLYETCLINSHMRPLNLWRHHESVREKDKRLFGEEFFNDLLNLNKADVTAH